MFIKLEAAKLIKSYYDAKDSEQHHVEYFQKLEMVKRHCLNGLMRFDEDPLANLFFVLLSLDEAALSLDRIGCENIGAAVEVSRDQVDANLRGVVAKILRVPLRGAEAADQKFVSMFELRSNLIKFDPRLRRRHGR